MVSTKKISLQLVRGLMRIVRHWYLFVIAVILALFFAYERIVLAAAIRYGGESYDRGRRIKPI